MKKVRLCSKMLEMIIVLKELNLNCEKQKWFRILNTMDMILLKVITLMIPYIKRAGRIYVGEAEKFVLELWSHGVRNTGGTGGKELSQYQIDMLIRLGVEVIFCFDEDVTKEELELLAERFPNGMPLYYMFDEEKKLLHEHESPSDNPEIWDYMVEHNIYKLR